MYKLLIVDDEAIESEALQRIVRAQYAGRFQVDTASNGKMAVAKAEAMRADIVLMDIEMPGLSGLEAARIIREMMPRCRIIIITAYQQFQYAQQAIDLGAEGYLLKPIANKDLFHLLDRATEEIDLDRRDVARSAALDQLAKEQLVLSVISGYASEASLAAQLAALGTGFTHGFFCVARETEGERADALQSLLAPRLAKMEGIDVLAYAYDDQLLVAVIMDGPYYDEAAILAVARAVPLHVGIGAVVTGLKDLQQSYDQAVEALALCDSQNPVQLYTQMTSANPFHRNLERKLYGYLLDKDMDSALKCIETMFDTLLYALKQPEAVMRTARKVLQRVAARLQEDARLSESLAEELSTLEAEAESLQEMSVRIRSLLSAWIAALDAQPPAHLQRIRGDIERYIRENFAQDLSIKQVAKAMHYSEPYFSKLFSRCFHKNFVAYLTEIRMQAAREMLEDEALSIRDVSVGVGFADANYFAKVFRKAFGISPTEFRRFASIAGDRP